MPKEVTNGMEEASLEVYDAMLVQNFLQTVFLLLLSSILHELRVVLFGLSNS